MWRDWSDREDLHNKSLPNPSPNLFTESMVRWQVRRSQRSFPTTQADVSSEEKVHVRSVRGRHVVPRTDGELPAIVPESWTLIEAGRCVPRTSPIVRLGRIGGGFGRWPNSSEFAVE